MTTFFIIGPPKTGTTLLARLIDRHPNACCMRESYVMAPLTSPSLWNIDSAIWKTHGFLAEFVRAHTDFWTALFLIHTPPEEIQACDSIENWAQIFEGIPDEVLIPTLRKTTEDALSDFARRCYATVSGDKWPFYLNGGYWRRLRLAFPEAKLIYTTRDPRGIFVSGVDYDQRQAVSFFNMALAQDETLHSDPDLAQLDLIKVRFEDLLTDPNQQLYRVWQHLGLKAIAYEDLPQEDPYPKRWHIPNASGPIDPQVADKWRQRLTPGANEQVIQTAATYMQRHGYLP